MNQEWILRADELGKAIASSISAKLDRRELTERLLEFVFSSASEGSAVIKLHVSPSEVIVSAGRGARFELDPLPASSSEALRLARAIGNGGLTEMVGPRLVRFELVLDDGSRLTGGSAGRHRHPEGRQTIHYTPFAGEP